MYVDRAVAEALQFFSEINEGFFFFCPEESEVYVQWIKNYVRYKANLPNEHNLDSQHIIDIVKKIADDEHVQKKLKLEITTLKSGNEWIVKNTSSS